MDPKSNSRKSKSPLRWREEPKCIPRQLILILYFINDVQYHECHMLQPCSLLSRRISVRWGPLKLNKRHRTGQSIRLNLQCRSPTNTFNYLRSLAHHARYRQQNDRPHHFVSEKNEIPKKTLYLDSPSICYKAYSSCSNIFTSMMRSDGSTCPIYASTRHMTSEQFMYHGKSQIRDYISGNSRPRL